MDPDLAQVIAHDTRSRAVGDARADLARLQERAVEAGREESRRLVKVSHIDRASGQARYRPAGRLLRDWYLHCYLNLLRTRLGFPAVRIDAQQIEDTAALLHRLSPRQPPLAALRAVAVLRNIADADAARATVTIITSLHATATRRAIAHAPDTRFDADPIRIQVTRHWYLHCYLDHLHTATRSQPPQHAISDAATHQIATTLTSRTIQPFVSSSSVQSQTAEPHTLGTGRTLPNPAEADTFDLSALAGRPEEAARIMFNHPATLETRPIVGTAEPDTGTERMPLLTDPFTDGATSELSPPQIRHA